jgi:pyrophosphatase PpaX
LKPLCRGVVFDLDGTLVDSMPMVMRAYAHALQPYFPNISEEELRNRLGGPPDRLFAEMMSAVDSSDALQRLHAYSVENWKLMQPFEGMADMLDELRSQVPVAIWTGRDRTSTELVLNEHSIAKKVHPVVCGDDLTSHKPDPAGLAEVLRRLRITPVEAIFVGDADVDVMAGAALGVRTVLITHDRIASAAIQRQAWRVVETPTQAYSVLRTEIARG